MPIGRSRMSKKSEGQNTCNSSWYLDSSSNQDVCVWQAQSWTASMAGQPQPPVICLTPPPPGWSKSSRVSRPPPAPLADPRLPPFPAEDSGTLTRREELVGDRKGKWEELKPPSLSIRKQWSMAHVHEPVKRGDVRSKEEHLRKMAEHHPADRTPPFGWGLVCSGEYLPGPRSGLVRTPACL